MGNAPISTFGPITSKKEQDDFSPSLFTETSIEDKIWLNEYYSIDDNIFSKLNESLTTDRYYMFTDKESYREAITEQTEVIPAETISSAE